MNANVTQLSPAEQFAAETRATIVPSILKTIKETKHLALFIVLSVMTVSYQHMRHYFVTKQADTLGSLLLPIIIDASIIFFIRVISTAGMAKLPKRLATGALVVPISASGVINFSASPNSTIGWVYVTVIGLVAFIEIVKSTIKPDPEELQAEENKIPTPQAAEIDEELKAKRAAAGRKAAMTKRENAANEAAKAEAKREARRLAAAARRVAQLAPQSSYPAVVLSAADKEALKTLLPA